ncbi:MAG: amidohydrolase family protein [Candidatus Dormibacteraceae bacterium]
MRTIALEEHFATATFMEGPGRVLRERRDLMVGRDLISSLLDVGRGRIQAMDEARIDVQVLSISSPGVEQLPPSDAVALARSINDELRAAIRLHPDRLAGLATLPTPDPAAAVEELRRAHEDLGFPGAAINGHVRGRYLDDEVFWPVLAEAERLRVPIYLHPTPPPPAVAGSYAGNYPAAVAAAFATSGWGWHVETAEHVLRLILSGAFDHYPALELVVGHLGELLPFMLPRFDQRFPRTMTKLERPVSAYLRENLHYTISGFNWIPAFLDLLLEVGSDRIMFSADHPYASMQEARAFLDGLPISDADREKIAHGNAERLYGY